MWFLADNVGAVPAGKPIFFPVINYTEKGLEFGSLRIREECAEHETFYASPATCLAARSDGVGADER